ncbi:MAG TPA: CHAP domain-containing protein [Bacillota bacterium]|nr:CHAP domain-containing protein [Bacillota bacterium]
MKQKATNKKTTWYRLTGVPVLTLASVLTLGLSVVPSVRADQYDQQIAALRAQNAQSQDVLNGLLDQASSYQDAINKLQAQIDAVQRLINDNVAQQTKLQQQIDTNQAELDREKAVLGADIKQMYVDGQPTTIEMLASSGNLSDFVDKQQYRTDVQNKVQETLLKINALQRQLKEQKTKVDQLLADQRTQQSQLDSDRSQQASLLAYNQDQQNTYNKQIKANQTKMADLRHQQTIENAKLFGNGLVNIPDTTGYPWAGAGFPNGGYDPWGMEYRQCVSYTAWRVWHETGYMYGWGNIGMGNANQWDDDARATGIPVDNNPRGDVVVGIKNSQPWGHAVYIEHVYDNGDVYISQYNALYDGNYSEARISKAQLDSSGWVFIHFR